MRTSNIEGDNLQNPITATIRKGNIFSTITCDGHSYPYVQACFEATEKRTKFHSQGYEFSKAYKEGWWDGYIRVVNASNKKLFGVPPHGFYTGYMRDVVTDLMKAGISIQSEIVDVVSDIEEHERRVWPWNEEKFGLRDYQVNAINVASSKTRGVINFGTGSGKTIIGCGLVRKLGIVPVVFFVTTKDLLYQAQSRFQSAMPGVEVGIVGDGICEIKDITVCTIQSCSRAYGMSKIYDKELKQLKSVMEFDTSTEAEVDGNKHSEIRNLIETARVVIFDEVHRAPCDMCRAVLEMTHKAVYRYGLGATVIRDDGMDKIILGLFGDILAKMTASELIEAGHLIRPTIFMMRVRTGSLKFDSYQTEYKQSIVENVERNSIGVNIAKSMAENNKPTLMLVKQISHGNILMDMLGPDSGFMLITGKESAKKREEAFGGIISGAVKGVIATALADEGLDLPNLECLILMGGGKSQTSVNQRIGRVLRQHPDGREKDALVYDFMDSSNYMAAQSKRRLALYKREPAFKIEMIEN